jgi:hypothetical protein
MPTSATLEGRSYDNEGLNANIGLVVTSGGRGADRQRRHLPGGCQIAKPRPRKSRAADQWVINTGGQDHRWLGNGYFAGQRRTDHRPRKCPRPTCGRGQVTTCKVCKAYAERADGTVPTLPTRWLTAADTRLEFGGTVLEFKHRQGGHTPGDMMVWLPQKNLLFTGDVVYVERMLGVLPEVSNTKDWLASFAVIETATQNHRAWPRQG